MRQQKCCWPDFCRLQAFPFGLEVLTSPKGLGPVTPIFRVKPVYSELPISRLQPVIRFFRRHPNRPIFHATMEVPFIASSEAADRKEGLDRSRRLVRNI